MFKHINVIEVLIPLQANGKRGFPLNLNLQSIFQNEPLDLRRP